MRRRQPNQIARRAKPHAFAVHWTGGLCGLGLLCVLGGCNSFGNSRLVKELQSENERLLSEFRGQRDRAAQLEQTNRLQAERLAESEKLLARLSQAAGADRLSSLPQTGPAAGPAAADTNGAQPTHDSSADSPAADQLRWQPRYDSRP